MQPPEMTHFFRFLVYVIFHTDDSTTILARCTAYVHSYNDTELFCFRMVGLVVITVGVTHVFRVILVITVKMWSPHLLLNTCELSFLRETQSNQFGSKSKMIFNEAATYLKTDVKTQRTCAIIDAIKLRLFTQPKVP